MAEERRELIPVQLTECVIHYSRVIRDVKTKELDWVGIVEIEADKVDTLEKTYGFKTTQPERGQQAKNPDAYWLRGARDDLEITGALDGPGRRWITSGSKADVSGIIDPNTGRFTVTAIDVETNGTPVTYGDAVVL